ncbi:DUF2789 domain-containing protein [Pseudomonas sp. JDS28PS106]|uniref:DUF2789 domain-containing protein n=1 Tax=Pseudomonas sp. JDS28PS106 TaxID=2497235 RepID=UPI002FD3FA6D
MELQARSLADLFAQLGLDSDEASINEFVAAHSLPEDVKLSDADFWTDTQKRFLKEAVHDDADWAPIFDELNVLLHK